MRGAFRKSVGRLGAHLEFNLEGIRKGLFEGSFGRALGGYTVLLYTVLLFHSSTAEALRYFVKLKSTAYMAQLHSQEGRTGSMNTQVAKAMFDSQGSDSMNASLASIMEEATVDKTLPSLKAAVLSTTKPLDLRHIRVNSDEVEFIEEEYIYPPLKPLAYIDFFTASAIPQIPWGVQAIKAPDVWKMNITGKGTKVLVLDSGIDRDHPALKANFLKGKNFTTDSVQPYDYFDIDQHGTHVAGTIAAQQMSSGFVGVAPQAQILAGKVCLTLGCSSISIAEGLQWAIDEKVDVINMSLSGLGISLSEKAALQLVEKAGIVVVAATGNDGKNQVGYPAAMPTVIAVGSVNKNLERSSFSNYGKELDLMAPGEDVYSTAPVGSVKVTKISHKTVDNQLIEFENFPVAGAGELLSPIENVGVVYVGYGRKEDLSDQLASEVLGIPFQKMDLTGKIVLVQRSLLSFKDKVDNILEKGIPTAIIIFNHESNGNIHASISDGEPYKVPVFTVTKQSGELILSGIKAGSYTMSLESTKVDYQALDGTSMATPHVTGVVALIKSRNPSLRPEEIRNLLTSTATEMTPNNDHQVGSGLVNVLAAVQKLSVNH